MKFRYLIISLLIALAAPSSRAQLFGWAPKDMDLTYVVPIPSSGDYEGDFGFEGRIRKWSWGDFGWMTNLGIHQWSFNGVPSFIQGNVAGAESVDGSIGFLVAGLGGCYRMVEDDYKSVSFDAGLRFHSGLTEAKVRSRPSSAGTVEGDIKMTNNLLAWVGVDATYKPESWPQMLLGVGYQQDVVQGEITVNDRQVGDMELSGAYVRLGIRVEL